MLRSKMSGTVLIALLCNLALAAVLTGCASAQNDLVFSVLENGEANEIVGTVFSSPNGAHSFNFTVTACGDYFTIDEASVIRTRSQLDREEFFDNFDNDELSCNVQYTNTTTRLTRVTIRILDVNDNIPRFYGLRLPVHVIPIFGTMGVNSTLQPLEPFDTDKGLNGAVTFDLVDGNEDGFFGLRTAPGVNQNAFSTGKELFVRRSLEILGDTQFNLTLTIMDMGEPEPLSRNQTLIINITDPDTDDPRPITSSLSFAVPEDHPVGPDHPIGSVSSAVDNTEDNEVLYSIFTTSSGVEARDYFAVDAVTGDISLRQPLDFEAGSDFWRFLFSVQVQQSLINVMVEVMDVNDEYPHFTVNGVRTDTVVVSVTENNEEISLIPTVYVEDNDFNSTFEEVSSEVDVVSDPPVDVISEVRSLKVGTRQIRLITARLNQSLDREITPEVFLNLTVYNTADPPLSGTLTIHIIVQDENDNVPLFTEPAFEGRISEGAPVGKTLVNVQALDLDAEENGTINFSISAVSNPEAAGWFNINSTSGVVYVNSALDYSAVEGELTLTVTATDGGVAPRSDSTMVHITITPAVTFMPRSFQQYYGYDLLSGDSIDVYLEFRTTLHDALLLYQTDHGNRSVALLVEDGHVKAMINSTEISRTEMQVSDDRWYSVRLLSSQGMSLQVWALGMSAAERTNILMDSVLAGCDSEPQPGQHTLYVGGVDVLSLTDLTTPTDFVGAIRNVIIRGEELDLSCPVEEENTVLDSQPSAGACGTTLQCDSPRSMGCVDYGPTPYCSCLGGFLPDSCQDDTGYEPIRIDGSGRAELTLDYSFFFDLELHSQLSEVGVASERRKRNQGEGEEEEVLGEVKVSFRPVETGDGVLLYSQTPTSIHMLKTDATSSGTQSVIYTVSNSDASHTPIHIPLSVLPRALNTATITTTQSHVTMTVELNGTVQGCGSDDWGINSPMLFAQPPQTNISIGGSSQIGGGNFSGCITAFSINGIDVPLSGLLTVGQGGFTAEGSVVASCNLCETSPCLSNLSCYPVEAFGEFECRCPPEYMFSNETQSCLPVRSATPTPTVSTGGLENSSGSKFPLYIIVAIGVAVLIVVAVLVTVSILLIQYNYRRKQRGNRTYHVRHDEEVCSRYINGSINGHIPTAKPNQYTDVTLKQEEIPRPCFRDSQSRDSVTTYQQHDFDEDEDEISTHHPPFVRRRSTTSAETGFHTGSERDERSIPRMDDSGNEKDTEYSPTESESIDLTSSCLEEAYSPSAFHLIGSSGYMMVVPPSPLRTPLTPKELKALTPLRPNSCILSMSEYEYETDADTDFRYSKHHPRTAKGSKHLADSHSGTPTWYKSTTASDNEREKQRAHGGHVYYPTRSVPFQLSRPPQYIHPPTFTQAKSSSPTAPTFPSHPHSPHPDARLPNSPLSRLAHKYENVPSPISEPQQDTEFTEYLHTPDHPLAKSQPMRLNSLDSYFHYQDFPSHYPPPEVSSSYHRSYSTRDVPRKQPEQQFQDLKSVSRINPIAYWETQTRMKATVDQVDPYHLLSEPYVQFDDSSTQPSFVESMMTMEESDGPEHHEFSSQGGGEGTADMLEFGLIRLRDGDIDSMVTDPPDMGTNVTHFPSADCSDEYGTLVASSTDSSTPKQLSNSFRIPPPHSDV